MRSPASASTAAHVILAEIGTGHDPLPHRRRTCAPGPGSPPASRSRPGKKKGSGATGHGNRYLARVLGEAAVTAGRTDTFLGERYRRIARRRGKKKADRRGRPLGPGHRLAPAVRPRGPLPRPRPRLLRHPHRPRPQKRNHIRQLEALGYKVTFEPAA